MRSGVAVYPPVQTAIHPGHISGRWYGSIYTLASALDAPADSIRAFPILVEETLSIDGYGLRLTTGVAGNVQCAIYANAGGQPSGPAMAIGPEISTAVGTFVNGTFSPAARLIPGIYWLASNRSANGVSYARLNVIAGWSAHMIGADDYTIGLNVSGSVAGRKAAQTYGSWPNASSLSWSDETARVPAIVYRIASVP